MKKVLIITYYWPPSGGAGVQRWLKLSKYLAKQGVEVHVLTVDPSKASYTTVDERLNNDVSDKVKVYTTDTFEPLNFYGKMVGKSNVPKSGFSNVSKHGFKMKVAASIRSNFFIPDPRKGWGKHALKKAKDLINKEGIQHVITTSPPHSVQLIGLKLKRQYGESIKWISDLRDPWTDIYYYPLLNHSFYSRRIDAKYEKQVVEECDVLLTLGETFKQTFISKSELPIEDKVILFSNGYDSEDFENIKIQPDDSKYTITYTGTMADSYEPQIFFNAVEKLSKKYSDDIIEFKMVGSVTDLIKEELIQKLGDRVSFTPSVSHPEAVTFMCNADLLFVATPGDAGPVPGKIFEYIAANKPIIGVGKGDTADVLEKTQTGKAFSRTESNEIFEYLEKLYLNYKNNVPFTPIKKEVEALSVASNAKGMIDSFLAD
jgi:glycosyltransferase involved in cell wall biosynthesis